MLNNIANVKVIQNLHKLTKFKCREINYTHIKESQNMHVAKISCNKVYNIYIEKIR